MGENDKPIMRAYSIASANYEEFLEFFSIKVQDGILSNVWQVFNGPNSICSHGANIDGFIPMTLDEKNAFHTEENFQRQQNNQVHAIGEAYAKLDSGALHRLAIIGVSAKW